MDIRIILNPGAVGTPHSNAQSKKQNLKKKQKGYVSPIGDLIGCPKLISGIYRSRTPTSRQSSPGSAIARRSSLRATSSTRSYSNSTPSQKSYATPTPIHPIRCGVRQAPSSPLVRQSRTRKRVLELGSGFEGDATTPPKRGRSSTSTHSSRSSAGSLESAASAPSRASLLLSRAKQHVALEAVALGRRSRSMMDVVMDLKGPGELELEYHQEDSGVLMLIDDRRRSHRHDGSRFGRDYLLTESHSYLRRRDGKGEYVLTDDEGLAAYWADQAAIWMHTTGGGGGGSSGSDSNSNSDSDCSEVVWTRFPMSMERSTADWDSSSCS
ncbi:hypothetical protein C8R45DRAFT_1140054 [Mycena sanguinolenta]|nr:hypothetical protein C8R45DRAFT_1140054 [Mycena sanguinolenta]